MSGTTWTKFYWPDWLSDRGLRRSSYAARGLWMDMLCLASQGEPIGKLCINGDPLTAEDIARMTGGSSSEVETLIAELERNGVFSRDRNGVIYSRRMIEDAKKAATARKNGKQGGNPTLGKQKQNSTSDKPPGNPPDKPPDKGRDNTHLPFAICHMPERGGRDSPQPPEQAESQSSHSSAATRARTDLDDLETRLREAAGNAINASSTGLLVLEPVLGWLDEGLDLARDILPAIRDRAARVKRPQSISSWKFFDGAVRDWAHRRREHGTDGDAGRVVTMDEIRDRMAREDEMMTKWKEEANG